MLGQLGQPRGRFAPITARILNRTNRKINRAAVEALGLLPNDRVLDIGFGGGVGLEFALERLDPGTLVGLEISAEMISRARRRFAQEVEVGRLELRQGSVAAIPAATGEFNAIYAVNSVYFWSHKPAALAEIRRALAAGGRFVLAMEPGAKTFFQSLDKGLDVPTCEEASAMLIDAGFTIVQRTGPEDQMCIFRCR